MPRAYSTESSVPKRTMDKTPVRRTEMAVALKRRRMRLVSPTRRTTGHSSGREARDVNNLELTRNEIQVERVTRGQKMSSHAT